MIRKKREANECSDVNYSHCKSFLESFHEFRSVSNEALEKTAKFLAKVKPKDEEEFQKFEKCLLCRYPQLVDMIEKYKNQPSQVDELEGIHSEFIQKDEELDQKEQTNVTEEPESGNLDVSGKVLYWKNQKNFKKLKLLSYKMYLQVKKHLPIIILVLNKKFSSLYKIK